MKKARLNPQVVELLHQALETEVGGAQIYRVALGCARNPALTKEWTKYLAQTENHVQVLRRVFTSLGLDANQDTPGRAVVRQLAESLTKAMQTAKASGNAVGAELVAAECVTLAETKDHLNWQLLGEVAEQGDEGAEVLSAAVAEVEDQEDEHVYHTAGWARELWLASLGVKAILPPPEEKHDVRSMREAAAAKSSRSAQA